MRPTVELNTCACPLFDLLTISQYALEWDGFTRGKTTYHASPNLNSSKLRTHTAHIIILSPLQN